ncbi:hypothetical protein [Pseudomonas reinekei]|uniref:Uncharacterized protein n=2 Tax=Pseudomonas reinekei TaxID=395598 RepID=A0A6H9RFJ7_PSERE|nr:hypothetical protein [Pseudomonas reinekei]KAB0487327.1 hypothetical protein F7R15_05560 [Pseudomonas reinekei]
MFDSQYLSGIFCGGGEMSVDANIENGEVIVVAGDSTVDDAFWDGVPTSIYYHRHIRVPELTGEIEYQFKLNGTRLYIRTMQYMLTTRPVGKEWNRANINFEVRSGSTVRVNSPDSLIQNGGWYPYQREASVGYSVSLGASFRIGVHYDGTNNDTSEADHWGQWEEIIRRG